MLKLDRLAGWIGNDWKSEARDQMRTACFECGKVEMVLQF